MKTTFAPEEPKKCVYRDFKTFSRESFKNGLMSKTVDENVDYSKFEKKLIDTLNKHAPKKTKYFAVIKHLMLIKCCAVLL